MAKIEVEGSVKYIKNNDKIITFQITESITNFKTKNKRYNHFRCKVWQDSNIFGALANNLKEGQIVSIKGNIDENKWNEKTYFEISVKDFKVIKDVPSESQVAEELGFDLGIEEQEIVEDTPAPEGFKQVPNSNEESEESKKAREDFLNSIEETDDVPEI